HGGTEQRGVVAHYPQIAYDKRPAAVINSRIGQHPDDQFRADPGGVPHRDSDYRLAHDIFHPQQKRQSRSGTLRALANQPGMIHYLTLPKNAKFRYLLGPM